MLNGQVELLGVSAGVAGEDADDAASGVLGRVEIDHRRGWKSVAHLCSYGDVVVRLRVDRAEGHMTLQAQQRAAIAIGVEKQAEAAADHGARLHLICKAKARREVFEVALDAGAYVNAVAAGDFHRGGIGVEVGPAIGHFAIGAVILPAQPDVQRQLAAHAVVVGEVQAGLDAPLAGPGQREVLLDELSITEQEAGGLITSRTTAVGTGKAAREVETPVTAVGLILRNLPPEDAAAELQRVRAASPGDVFRVLEGVAAPENGQRAGMADSSIVSEIENRDQGMQRVAVGILDSQQVAVVRTARLKAFPGIVEYEAIEAEAQFVDEARVDYFDIAGHGVLHGVEGRPSEGILIAEADRFRQAGNRDSRKGIWRCCGGVLNGPAREKVVIRRELVINAHVALVPVLGQVEVRQIVVEPAGVLGQRIGGHEFGRHGIPRRQRNLVALERRPDDPAGGSRLVGKRVVNRIFVGEVSLPDLGCRHAAYRALYGVSPVSFVVHEEKGFVLAVVNLRQPHRPTQREPELVVAERREGRTFRVEEIASVHGGVAEEFEYAAVHLVGAGLGNHVDDRAGVAAQVGAVEVGLHFEFADRLDRRPVDDQLDQALIVVYAIVEKVVRTFAIAVGEDLGARPAIAGRAAALNRS